MRHGGNHGEVKGRFIAALYVDVDVVGRQDDALSGPEDDVTGADGQTLLRRPRRSSHAFRNLQCGGQGGGAGILRGRLCAFGVLLAGGGAKAILVHDLVHCLRHACDLDLTAHNFALVVGESVKGLDQLAILDKTLDLDLDAVTQAPTVHLEHLDLALDVQFAVLGPAVHIVDPAQLAGDADALAHVGPHAPLGEAVQGLLHRPALFADKVTAARRARAALAGLAVHDDDAALLGVQPITHARHDIGEQGEGRRMVVGEGVVVDAVVDVRVGVAGALSAELPDGPVVAMLLVEELDQRVERVAVGALRVGATGAGCGNDWMLSVAD